MQHHLLAAFRDYLVKRQEPQIQAWINRIDWTAQIEPKNANPLAPIRHLAQVAPFVGDEEAQLVAALAMLGAYLPWMQMYSSDDFGAFFTENYAHVQLIGPAGLIRCDDIAAGLVIYGPGIDYPDHWHEAEEIYIPLTGNGHWSRDGGPFGVQPAGSFIFHTSNMRHAIKADDSPLVALWVWSGGDLNQKAEY